MGSWPNGTSKLSAASQSAPLAISGGRAEPLDEPVEQLGAVRIARRVLRTVVRQAALSVPGVTRTATMRNGWPQFFGKPLPQHGVSLSVHGDVVAIDLFVITEPGARMVDVGTQVQEAVGAAVEHILGMRVSEINVYIQDVA